MGKILRQEHKVFASFALTFAVKQGIYLRPKHRVSSYSLAPVNLMIKLKGNHKNCCPQNKGLVSKFVYPRRAAGRVQRSGGDGTQ